MTVLKLILITLFMSVSYGRTPDKVYCVNNNCDEPISKAKTLLPYSSVDPDLISFRPNSEAKVFMKSAGTNEDLWFVTVNGKSGFANKRFLRENKILVTNLVVVPYEKKNDIVQPNKVQQAHEVFEGTTIYTTEAAVTEATTVSPVTTTNEHPTQPLENLPETNQSDNVLSNESQPDVDKVTDSPSDIQTASSTEEPMKIDVPVTSTEEAVTPAINDPVPEEKVNYDPKPTETSKEAVIQETPKDLPSNILTPEQDSSDSVSSNIAVTEPNPTEPEITDKEQNTSAEDNNVEKLQHIQESEKEANVIEQVNSYLIPEQPTLIPPIDTNIPEENKNNEPSNVNSIPVIEQGLPGPIPTESTQFLPTINPVLKPLNEPQTTDPVPITTETIAPLVSSPTQETIPPILNMQPVATESQPPQNLPPIFEYTTTNSEEANQYTTPSPTPLNNIYSTTTEEPTQADQESYSTTLSNEEIYSTNSLLEATYTTPTSKPEEETSQSLPEDSNPSETPYTDHQTPLEEVSSESPTEESSESFFSTVYSTVADLWPTSTESPDTLYNTDDYTTYESEKQSQDEGFSFWKYAIGTYYSIFGPSEESKAIFASVGETCFSDEYCDGTSSNGTNRLLTYLLTTASSVLLFTLGYYYIDNRRQDGRLIGTINSLQRDLLFSTKECEILKEELATTKSKLAGIEDSSFGMDDMVQSLKEEIDELKATNDRLRNSLDDNEKLLRVSENTAGELQNTLSEVENTLSELLTERANSEEQILELNGKIQAFEEELISVSRDRDNFQLKYVSAETALEEFKNSKKQLDEVNRLLSDAKNTIELQRHEIIALKDAIKELKSGSPSNVDAASLIDHTEIKAKLSKALEEKKSLTSKFESEHKERTRLAEELKTTQESLQTTSQNATEALTRLEVLGKYFQERESELMKELTAKESLWLSKQGESASTVEKIELLQQEVQRHKEKCDALTLELAERESSRRAALSEVESRAHSAWLEARTTRRDADAARDEAAALRRKLASLTTADGAVSPHHKISSPLESAEGGSLPPLPAMFLPPPLLPPLPPPLPRPPPLGRLPSPHPPRYGDRRYSPDSRYSPQSRYSPDSRYSPETVRYSPDSRYSPRRRSPYSPRSRRRSRSRERYTDGRGSRSRNGPAPADTETEYNSDSPSREVRRRGRYSRHSGPSSGSGCSSESDK